MKYVIILISIIIMLVSCTEPSSVLAKYQIINQTDHNIYLIYYNQDIVDSSEVIIYLDSIKFSRNSDNISDLAGPPPFHADSVEVFFDDSIKIIHYRTQNQGINKNIFEEDSWNRQQIDEYKYSYDYIFTEEDYIEAKEQ